MESEIQKIESFKPDDLQHFRNSRLAWRFAHQINYLGTYEEYDVINLLTRFAGPDPTVLAWRLPSSPLAPLSGGCHQ